MLQKCRAHGVQAVDIVKAALADVQAQLLCKLIENVWIGFEGQPSLAHAVRGLQCTLAALESEVSAVCDEASLFRIESFLSRTCNPMHLLQSFKLE